MTIYYDDGMHGRYYEDWMCRREQREAHRALQERVQAINEVEDTLSMLIYVKNYIISGKDVDNEPFLREDGSRIKKDTRVHLVELLGEVEERLWKRHKKLYGRCFDKD